MNLYPKISVVIPVYNVEKYLNKCIDSILCQTYSNFEIILVNDGSTDNCGAICDDYAKKDDRVRTFHKVNEGVSAARNYGISKAVGEYVCFVDSDDYIIDTYLADFFNNATCDADVYLQGYVNIYTNGKSNERIGFDSNEFYTIDSLHKGYIYSELNKLCNPPFLKLFKRHIIVQNDIKFDDTICYGEDHLFVLSYFLHIKNMSISATAGYFYIHRNNGSLSKKFVSHEKLFYYAEKSFSIRKLLINHFCIENRVFEYKIRREFVLQIFHTIFSMYNRKSRLVKSDRKNNLNRYVKYLEENRLLNDLNFKNYFYFTISKIVKPWWPKKDLSLYVFFNLRRSLKGSSN